MEKKKKKKDFFSNTFSRKLECLQRAAGLDCVVIHMGLPPAGIDMYAFSIWQISLWFLRVRPSILKYTDFINTEVIVLGMRQTLQSLLDFLIFHYFIY